MKVTRQSDLKESYQTTCDWLDEFIQGITKDANLEHLDVGDKSRIASNSMRFRTIEAKMEDIKKRIGFDLLMNHKGQNDTIVSEAENEAGQIKSASAKHDPEDVKAMAKILKYILEMIKSEPHLDTSAIIGRCREEDGLRFLDLPIDLEKLKAFIDKRLEKSCDENDVRYIPPEPISSSDSDDNDADYYQHAVTSV
nr:hypothetical protein 52 [bacterium]